MQIVNQWFIHHDLHSPQAKLSRHVIIVINISLYYSGVPDECKYCIKNTYLESGRQRVSADDK